MSTTSVVKRPRLYFGWYVLGVSMTGGFLAAGSAQLFMGIMINPMTAELGWSKTDLAWPVTAGTIGSGLLSPLFGYLTDRIGPRILSVIGVLIVSASFFLLAMVSRPDQLWLYAVAYIIGRSISSSTLTGVVPRTVAVNWFRRMRGRAVGMVNMALPLGGAVLAPIAQYAMDRGYSWRVIFFSFGVLTLSVLLIPMALVMRRRPEDMGLLPDGDTPGMVPPAQSAKQKKAAAEEYSWTIGEAIRTPAIWLIIAALMVGVGANGAIGYHQISYFTDKGITAGIAAVALSVYAVSGALANGVWGFLTEHVSERLLAVVTMVVASAITFFLVFVNTPWQAFIFAVIFGLAARGETSLVMIIVAQYYGRKSFGTISGFVTPFQLIGLGVGPLIAAMVYDSVGSYTVTFLVISLLYVVTAIFLWFARKPSPPASVMARESARV